MTLRDIYMYIISYGKMNEDARKKSDYGSKYGREYREIRKNLSDEEIDNSVKAAGIVRKVRKSKLK